MATTKTKPTKKPTAKTATKKAEPVKTSRADKAAAYQQGMQARNDEVPKEHNPIKDNLLLEAEWNRGWTEADNTIAEQTGTEAPTETINNTPQHEFDGDAVVLSREQLAALMQEFDNAGVLIVEEQWRALSEADQHSAARWLNARKIGSQCTVPECLHKYATPELMAEWQQYMQAQVELAKHVFPCQFGKPSPTKPDGDDSEEKIKLTITVPVDKLTPGQVNNLFGWRRCRIEFARKPVAFWDQAELPHTSQVINVIADVSGFSRNRTHWKFGFYCPTHLLSIPDAFDLWKDSGSCRVESLGEPPKPERDDADGSENGSAPDEHEPREVSQPSLFASDVPGNPVDDAGRFRDFDDYLIPLTHPQATGRLNVAQGPDGRFHIASDLYLNVPEYPMDALGDEFPTDEDDGYASLQLAVEAEVGWLIDALNDSRDRNEPAIAVIDKVVDELRDYLKKISAGEPPQRVPADISADDPSY